MKNIFYKTPDMVFDENDLYKAYVIGRGDGEAGRMDSPTSRFRELIASLASQAAKPLTLGAITDAVVEETGIEWFYIARTDSRRKEYVRARKLVCYFGWLYTEELAHAIRNHLHYNEHATVLHHANDVSGLLPYSKEYRDIVDAVKLRLHRKGYAIQEVDRKGIAASRVTQEV